jgi:hypothetical protein
LSDLAALVASSRWDGPTQEAVVFGTDDPAAVATAVGRWCVEHLGSAVADARFWHSSAGCTAGVLLADGRDVVVKAHPASRSAVHLGAVLTVQASLADQRYPCARPIVGPRPLGLGLGTAEGLRPDPGPSLPARAHSARALAQLVDRLRALDGSGLDEVAIRPHPLYPPPHHPVYDIAGTADGAAWIDGFAVRAAASVLMDPAPLVTGHLDWSARNVRIDRSGVVEALYDWDSLGRATESSIVGRAAVTWCLTGEPGGPEAPDNGAVEGFLEDYDGAITRPLTGTQWRAAKAAALWTLCHLARLEHALSVARPERAGPAPATATLRRELDTLLR